MNWIILIAGVAGLAIALYGFVTLVMDAARRRQYIDIVLAVALVGVVVWLLIAFGDRLLR